MANSMANTSKYGLGDCWRLPRSIFKSGKKFCKNKIPKPDEVAQCNVMRQALFSFYVARRTESGLPSLLGNKPLRAGRSGKEAQRK